MSELGRCQYDPCGQTDLLAYDGYCSSDHQEADQEEAMDRLTEQERRELAAQKAAIEREAAKLRELHEELEERRCRPCRNGRHDRCLHPFIGQGADFCCCVDMDALEGAQKVPCQPCRNSEHKQCLHPGGDGCCCDSYPVDQEGGGQSSSD